MFEGFDRFDMTTTGAVIHGVTGGSGPALLLLHGYPQTHAMWHAIAPRLAEHYTVIAADLRGYGRSSKPPTDAHHRPYSKREMARDMVEIMERLGHSSFFVGSHDRGSRVGHRMAIDWPTRVRRLAVLDIAPTREMYRNTTQEFARAYWHWFFLIQKAPLPEMLINAAPRDYWLIKCGSGSAGLAPFADAALEDYLKAWSDPATVHAACEDYRAAAGIDIEHDDEDGDAKIAMPLLALWGEHGVIERCFDCLALWRQRASNVRGHALPGGHYLAEELPDAVFEAFHQFFSEDLS